MSGKKEKPSKEHVCTPVGVAVTGGEARFLAQLCYEAKVTVKSAGAVVDLINRLETYADSNPD